MAQKRFKGTYAELHAFTPLLVLDSKCQEAIADCVFDSRVYDVSCTGLCCHISSDSPLVRFLSRPSSTNLTMCLSVV